MCDRGEGAKDLEFGKQVTDNCFLLLRKELDGHFERPAFTGGFEEVSNIPCQVGISALSWKSSGKDLHHVDQDVALQRALEDALDDLCGAHYLE